mgnify:CR=1 FL=1
MIRYLTLLLFVFLIVNQHFAQELEVRNLGNEERIENVAVFNQHMNKATLSSELGIITIYQFDLSDTLYFQHPSFETKIIPYSQLPKNRRIYLERKNILIPEFVVTASKHRENKKEVSYYVDVLSSKKLEQIPSQNSADF